jgi:hypothetical protein
VPLVLVPGGTAGLSFLLLPDSGEFVGCAVESGCSLRKPAVCSLAVELKTTAFPCGSSAAQCVVCSAVQTLLLLLLLCCCCCCCCCVLTTNQVTS